MILAIIIIILILLISYDAYNTIKNKSYSRIIHYTKKYYNRFHNYHIRRHKIIMLDIDNEEIRDYDTIQTKILIEKLNNIIHAETTALTKRIDTYKTRHGRHIIIFLHNHISTREALIILDRSGVDEKYKQIFLIRGHFSLFQVRRGEPNIKELETYNIKDKKVLENEARNHTKE
jgi:hypothetical protein